MNMQYIEPRNPQENGHIVSFNAKLYEDVHSREAFYTLSEVKGLSSDGVSTTIRLTALIVEQQTTVQQIANTSENSLLCSPHSPCRKKRKPPS